MGEERKPCKYKRWVIMMSEGERLGDTVKSDSLPGKAWMVA
jgi:hypothetical protein